MCGCGRMIKKNKLLPKMGTSMYESTRLLFGNKVENIPDESEQVVIKCFEKFLTKLERFDKKIQFLMVPAHQFPAT